MDELDKKEYLEQIEKKIYILQNPVEITINSEIDVTFRDYFYDNMKKYDANYILNLFKDCGNPNKNNHKFVKINNSKRIKNIREYEQIKKEIEETYE